MVIQMIHGFLNYRNLGLGEYLSFISHILGVNLLSSIPSEGSVNLHLHILEMGTA